MSLYRPWVKDKKTGTSERSPNWTYSFKHNGKLYRKTTSTANKALAAKIEAKALREAVESSELGAAKLITLNDALQNYLDSKKKSGEYDNYVRIVSKVLGKKQNKQFKVVSVYGIEPTKTLNKVSTADIQNLVLARRKEGNADATILHELILINQTIKLNKRLGYMTPVIDFADIKKNSQLKPSNTRTRYLTDREETKLLAELSQEDRDFYVTLLDSGARWGEIAKLPWSQVDIDNRVILLYRFKTKNESLLPMTDRVYDTMKRRHEAKRIDQKFVFENSEQNSRNYSLSPIKRAAKRAGIAGVTHHVARHTVGTRLTIAGESPQTLQALFGHATINMSMRYQHMSPSTAMTKAVRVLQQREADVDPVERERLVAEARERAAALFTKN